MKIAICDDSMKDLAAIELLLEKYRALYPQAEFTTEKFVNPSHLSEKIREKKMADIYILDIIMTGTTGIDIGNQIKRSGSDAAIIYTTSSDDFALDAYDVHAVNQSPKINFLKPWIMPALTANPKGGLCIW